MPTSRKSGTRCMAGKLPDGWDADIPTFPADAKGVAGRDAGNKVMNAIAKHVPWFLGGAADLAPSTKTLIKDGGDFERGNYDGRNFHFGIREHAMGSILNGMALSGLAAVRVDVPDLLRLHEAANPPVGPDGDCRRSSSTPTTPSASAKMARRINPSSRCSSLRSVPRLIDFRPADANEVAVAWKTIMQLTTHSRGDRAQPPAASDLRSHEVCECGRNRQRRIHPRRQRRRTRSDPDGHRLRGAALRQRSRGTPESRESARASSAFPLGSSSNSNRRSIAIRCCRQAFERAWRWKRAPTWAGASTSEWTARSSLAPISEPRHPSRIC